MRARTAQQIEYDHLYLGARSLIVQMITERGRLIEQIRQIVRDQPRVSTRVKQRLIQLLVDAGDPTVIKKDD